MLLLDLDYTIFPTNTIPTDVFLPLLQMAEAHILSLFGSEQSEAVQYDLWHSSFDQVAKKYKLSDAFQQAFYEKLNVLDYDLEIQTFSDYHHLVNIPQERILVTTGFARLQHAKINALGIQQDFSEIHIDDPADEKRLFKAGIFAEILQRRNLVPQDVFVIGDSPENELRAAKSLGIPTIQRLKPGAIKSDLADFAIHSFSELSGII